MAYRVINIVKDLPKGRGEYSERPLSQITDIVVHHSAASPNFGPYDFAKWHIEKKDWPGIAYHYVLMADGKIYQTNELETVSYHALGHNSYTCGICLSGNFEESKVPQKQLDALVWLIRKVKGKLPNFRRVNPHGFYKSTQCPGKNMPMDKIRARVEKSTDYSLYIAGGLVVVGLALLLLKFLDILN